jgi:putative membrane protein
MRVTVFRASSSTSQTRSFLASLIQPLSCLGPFVIFWASRGVTAVTWLPFLAASLFVGYLFGFFFVFQLDNLGRKLYGIPALPLFRAFMLNWVAGLNGPFEEYLERLGEKADIEVSFLRFDSSQPKAAIIVPSVHPGPFKNIGSSLLPSLLKEGFENFYKCVACVPLGILGHELDLASQAQNKKIVDSVVSSANKVGNEHEASPSVRVTDGNATVYCQIFGSTVLLSFTFAPNTTEDLPQELGHVVRQEALKRGLKSAVVINAHNSINDDSAKSQINSLETLQNLSAQAIKKALSGSPAPFKVGASTVYPKDFTLTSGMGAGGITAIVLVVANQKTAYVVVDGNNMVTGLRERILEALSSQGFDQSEVFTTDTHAVSAVVLGRRGYYPVGEAMDHDALIGHIVDVVKAAEANLERCRSLGQSITIPDVTVIGEARLNSLSLLVDKAIHRAKYTVIPFFGIEALLLTLLLLLL